MNSELLTRKANRTFFAALPLLVLLLSVSSANAQSSPTAQITVSLKIVESPPVPNFQAWFESFFTDTTPNHMVTSSSDYDGDGQLDYLEYYAGTDPTDGASALKIVATDLSGEDAVIAWSSTSSTVPEPRKYRIFRCGPDALSDLADPNATITGLQSNDSVVELNNSVEIASQGETTAYTDADVESLFPLFYRVFLSQPEPQAPASN